MDYVNLVVLAALIEYAVFIGIVGGTRGKYGVVAPEPVNADETLDCLIY